MGFPVPAEVLPPYELTLEQLAAVANREHDAAEEQQERFRDAMRSSLQHALRAGEALLEAKERLGHGEYGKWETRHFHGSAKLAYLYRKLADPANRQRVSDLPAATSIRGALEAIAGQEPPAKERQPRHEQTELIITGTQLAHANRVLRKLLKPFEPLWERADEIRSELAKVPARDAEPIRSTLRDFRNLSDLVEDGLPTAKPSRPGRKRS